MSVWGKQIGLGFALVLAVALVTLLFSFLGTIACAGFMHFTKTNLTSQQNTVLPLVCFGAFWLTYLLTCALAYFEKRESAAAESANRPAARMEASPSAAPARTGAADRVMAA